MELCSGPKTRFAPLKLYRLTIEIQAVYRLVTISLDISVPFTFLAFFIAKFISLVIPVEYLFNLLKSASHLTQIIRAFHLSSSFELFIWAFHLSYSFEFEAGKVRTFNGWKLVKKMVHQLKKFYCQKTILIKSFYRLFKLKSSSTIPSKEPLQKRPSSPTGAPTIKGIRFWRVSFKAQVLKSRIQRARSHSIKLRDWSCRYSSMQGVWNCDKNKKIWIMFS